MQFTIEQLRSKPWRNHQFNDLASAMNSMITFEERQLVSWLASNFYSGKGYIVDLGCFVGAETATFASSLPQNIQASWDSLEEKPIQAYDLFIQSDGNSFFPEYANNIQPYERIISTHSGDINTLQWNQGFIEILFNDISKSVETNATVINKFFPSLTSESVLIQQDYHDDHFWVPITMEILSDYFTQLDGPIGGTALYLCTKKIPYDRLTYAANPNFEDCLAAIRKVQKRYQGWYKRLFQLCEARMLTHFGKPGAAINIIQSVTQDYPNHKILSRRIDRAYKAAMRKQL